VTIGDIVFVCFMCSFASGAFTFLYALHRQWVGSWTQAEVFALVAGAAMLFPIAAPFLVAIGLWWFSKTFLSGTRRLIRRARHRDEPAASHSEGPYR
jgi:hypothetical protein